MHILIATNAFKNSLSAGDAAFAVRDGLMQSDLHCTCECFPIGDGGDGTDDLIIRKFGGTIMNAKVQDPLGRSITADFGFIDAGKTAVIGMSKASGLNLLEVTELNPLLATSFGTGEQIRLALDKGATRIIIGMGGSATVDGGTGMLNALGIRFFDKDGNRLSASPQVLAQLARVDFMEVDERIFGCEIIVLCDVDNLLLGEQGAAAVFGPQKGASPEAVIKLEAFLSRLAEVTLKQTGRDISTLTYGGTAGGAAAGLYAFLDAKLVNGIAYYLELTDFDKALEKADLVITGEGSIDEQTLQGKGPFGVAYKAKLKGIPVIGLAGKVPLARNPHLQQYFDVLMPVGHEPSDTATAIRNTAANLTRTAREAGNLLSLMNKQTQKKDYGMDTGN